MPGTPDSPARGVRRVELTTPTPEPVAEFYARLLGWVIIAEPDGSFTGWVGDRLATHVRPGDPGRRLVFAATDTRDLPDGAATDTGRVLHGPWAPPPRPGEPCWVELMGGPADDDYWATALGWQVRDPDADFTLYDATTADDRRPVAGRLTAPGGWTCYYAVPDTTRAAADATALGGTVLIPPREVPTGHVAAIADPTGTAFAILENPPGWGGTWSTTEQAHA
ncbi:VOC family protein [Actinosynnema sp. NPDC059335]|uniref:VOC family protein n=1 Tax=Actinosynnema sp. NPDC059335 TaxID=3346804 RepID=UPI00366D7FBF